MKTENLVILKGNQDAGKSTACLDLADRISQQNNISHFAYDFQDNAKHDAEIQDFENMLPQTTNSAAIFVEKMHHYTRKPDGYILDAVTVYDIAGIKIAIIFGGDSKSYIKNGIKTLEALKRKVQITAFDYVFIAVRSHIWHQDNLLESFTRTRKFEIKMPAFDFDNIDTIVANAQIVSSLNNEIISTFNDCLLSNIGLGDQNLNLTNGHPSGLSLI